MSNLKKQKKVILAEVEKGPCQKLKAQTELEEGLRGWSYILV